MSVPASSLLCLFLAVSTSLWQTTMSDSEVCYSAECRQRAKHMRAMRDVTENPCVDFWQYACGGITNTDQTTYVGLWAQKQVTADQVRQLLSSPIIDKNDSSAVKMTKRFYQSCVNRTQLRLLKDRPLLHVIKMMFRRMPIDLTSRLITISRMSISPLLFVGVGIAHRNTSRYSLTIKEPVLSQSRARYLNMTSGQQRSRYLNFFNGVMGRVLRNVHKSRLPRMSQTFLKKLALKVINLEIQLAKITRGPTLQRFRPQNIKTHTISDLQNRYPAIDWRRYFRGIFAVLGVNKVPLPEDLEVESHADPYLNVLFPLLNNTGPQTILYYLMWSAAQRLAFYSMGKIARLSKRYKKLTKQYIQPTKGQARQMYCAELTEYSLSEVVGHMYMEAFTSSNQRNHGQAIVNDVVLAIKRWARNINWLSMSAKRHVMKKLEGLKVAVGVATGYEDMAVMDKDYRRAVVSRLSFLQNYLTIRRQQMRRILLMFKHQPGLPKIVVSSADVAVSYHPYYNIMFVPSVSQDDVSALGTNSICTDVTGILWLENIATYLPVALNYASLLPLVGSKIIRVLIQRRPEHDANGNVHNWWEARDEQEYNQKADCLWKLQSISSSQQTNTNTVDNRIVTKTIADSRGLHDAFLAFGHLLSLIKSLPLPMRYQLPGLPDMTHEKLFFLAFAQMRCKRDFPLKYRVMGSIVNNPKFGDVFNCFIDSPMDPKKKCSI